MNISINFKGLCLGLLMNITSQLSIFLYEKLYIKEVLNHLFVFEGTPLTFLFLAIYWVSGTLPDSYYDMSLNFEILNLNFGM